MPKKFRSAGVIPQAFCLLLCSLFSSCASSSNPAGSSSTAPDSGYFTDARDLKIYKWVTIGSQTWMAKNLDFDTLNDTGS
jgi:hypothetical protein